MRKRIPKSAFFEWIGYEIYSEDVLAMHDATGRIVIVDAPARTSKSFSAAAEAGWRATPLWDEDGKPWGSQLIWIVGPNFGVAKEFDYLYDWFVSESHLHALGTVTKSVNSPNAGNMRIEIEWGYDKTGRTVRTIIEGKSATNEKALQGEEVDVCIMSEAAEQPAYIYEKYLSTRCGTVFMPTTPKPHADWIKKLIDAGNLDPELGIDHIHYRNIPAWNADGSINPEKSISANPKFDWGRFGFEWKLAASRVETGNPEDDPRFAEQFLGLWSYYTGAVLPFRWQASIPGRMSHVVDVLPENFDLLKKFVSVDYGFDHRAAALFWAVLPDGTLVIFEEVVGRGMNQWVFCERIQEKIDALGVHIQYAVGDPSRPEVASMMRDHGFPLFDVGDKNVMRDREGGGTALVNMLSDNPTMAPPRPMLFVHRNCTHTIEEFKTLRRKEGYVGDEFAKSAFEKNCDDDCFDAARYGLMTRPKPYEEEAHAGWLEEWERDRRQAKSYEDDLLRDRRTYAALASRIAAPAAWQ